MDKMLIFDYMEKDILRTHVEVNRETGEVTAINYTDDIMSQAFGLRPLTIENVNFLFESRCFSRNRPDKQELLESIGLNQFCPYDIVRKTHGKMWTDWFWLRFEGETWTWEDISEKCVR